MALRKNDIVRPWGYVDFVVNKRRGNKVWLESDSGNEIVVDIREMENTEVIDRLIPRTKIGRL